VPFFFSQKKSGKKEKGRKTTYQDKFFISELKFLETLKNKTGEKFLRS
jgi:hypothetical protein